MNPELRKTAQNFLTAYEEANDLPIINPMRYKECRYYLEWAVQIISECIVEDYKIIPQDQIGE